MKQVNSDNKAACSANSLAVDANNGLPVPAVFCSEKWSGTILGAFFVLHALYSTVVDFNSEKLV